MFSRVPDLYPLDAKSIPPPVVTKNISRHCHIYPTSQDGPLPLRISITIPRLTMQLLKGMPSLGKWM